MRNYRTQALLVSTALALASVTMAAPAAAQQQAYKIPAMPLGESLREFGKASGKQIIFSDKLVRGKMGARVQGNVTPKQALTTMLAGTGLEAKQSATGAYLIVATTEPALGESAAGNVAADNQDVVAANSSASYAASTVVDERTGAALKGALVELVGTGEKTSTGDLGDFRFPGKTGRYEIRVSYLGYPKLSQTVQLSDGRATAPIMMSDGSTEQVIVVTAYQSGRAQALNQERTAPNVSTVVSADLLGQFDGNTISDALRRVSGVAFRINEATGDGTNIIVRGLPSSFNTITLNGLRLPVSDGLNRSPDLSNILADSVSKITLNKSLLPSQDGSGTGALVEIETKGPLDRPRRYFNFSMEKALSGKSFLNESAYSGTASFAFGSSKNFGISASVQYRKRKIDSVSLGGGDFYFGQYLPAMSAGNPVFTIDDIDPLERFPFDPDAREIYASGFSVSQDSTSIRNLAIGLSAQWKIGEHTELKADFNRFKSTSTGYTRSRLLNLFYGYETLPISELNGELRPALVWEDAFGQDGLVASSAQSATINPGSTNSSTAYGLKGESSFSRLTLTYNAGYTKGRSRSSIVGLRFVPTTNFQFSLTDLLPQVAGNTVDGRVVSPFLPAQRGSISLPGLSQAGYELINDPSLYFVRSISKNDSSGFNQRLTAAMNAKYEFESPILKYLQAGLFYERSKSDTQFEGASSYRLNGAPQTMANIGLDFDGGILDRVGYDNVFPVTSASALNNLFEEARNGTSGLFTTTAFRPDPLDSRNGTTEQDLAAYLQAHITVGKLDIIGGIRAERVKTHARSIVSPFLSDENGIPDQEFIDSNIKIVELSGKDTTILPRVTFNYRFNENLVLRAGYYLAIARPSIQDLNSGVSVLLFLDPNYGPNGNQPYLLLSTGNPGLKAASTHNFDASVEWYSNDIGALKLGAFYKPTTNAFFSSKQRLVDGPPADVILPDDPRFQAPNLYIEYVKPQNDPETITIWGIEASVERKLGFLSNRLNRFGVYANGTYTKSSRNVPAYYSYAPSAEVLIGGVPYADSPKYSGTVAITYDHANLSASLSYTKQAKLLDYFAPRGLSRWRGEIDSLDFRASYQAKVGRLSPRLYVEGSNLLKGSSDPNSVSYVGGARASETYLGGRSVRIGVSATF